MIGGKMSEFIDDQDMLVKGLWQGSRPLIGEYFGRFDLVVFCANEFQPNKRQIEELGIREALVAGFNDSPFLDGDDYKAINLAVSTVSARLRAKETILVTCMAGMNRSGLVSALSMMDAYDFTADRAIKTVRRARGPFALGNDTFLRMIYDVEEDRRGNQ